MLDIKLIRENVEEIKQNVLKRRSKVDIDKLLEIDKKYNDVLFSLEELRAERNKIALESKDPKKREQHQDRSKEIKVLISEKEELLKTFFDERQLLLMQVPNLTHKDVPDGDDDADNKVLYQRGEKSSLTKHLDHMELSKKYDLIDFERGAKVVGSKFYFLKGKMAILEQALIRYGIDFAIKNGFEFIATPDLAKEEVLVGKGFLPRGPEKQVYYIEEDDLALIGSAEITILGYHMNEKLDADKLPKKYVAFSHCFRREAGAYGRESYGLYRVHQFSKVELFSFAKEDQSEALHLEFLKVEEEFWKSLNIPYQVVDCSSGDLGGSDYRRYDIEAWMWGKNDGKGGYGEVTSCSNCIDYQSRGLNIKDTDKKFVHTLNGTMVAAPRALITVLENYQQEDGTIKIPDVLIPYCGFDVID